MDLFDTAEENASVGSATASVSCGLQGTRTKFQDASTVGPAEHTISAVSALTEMTVAVTATAEAVTVSSAETSLPTEVATPVVSTSAVYATSSSLAEGSNDDRTDAQGQDNYPIESHV